MCLHPIGMYKAYKNPATGKIVYSGRCPSCSLTGDPDIFVPCGKCVGCREDKRKEWSKRLQAEIWNNPVCCFVTLTYDDAHLPFDRQPSRKHVQNFIKRLRHLKRDYGIEFYKDFRYFIVSEFGAITHRPHYHGLLFGVDFLDKRFSPRVATLKDLHPIYTCAALQRLWSNGFVSVDAISPAVVNYCTKYMCKYQDNPSLFKLYSRGLGVRFFINDDNTLTDSARQAYGLGFVQYRAGRSSFVRGSIPKYIDRRVDGIDPDLLIDAKASRRAFAMTSKFVPVDFAAAEALYNIRNKTENEKRKLDEN